VQANKAGLLEIADVFVINKADRKGVDETRRDLEQMLELSDLDDESWRPPIIPVVATEGTGIEALWESVLQHRAFIEASGELTRRREFRLRDELREIVARRLELRARQVTTGERWEQLQSRVLDRSLDPWGAADEMLRPVNG
jgi:LAO/AO transport system kinase